MSFGADDPTSTDDLASTRSAPALGARLARLAPDESRQHQGIGGALLAEALGRVIVVIERVAARFVVVHAIDEQAASLYAHQGFRRIQDPSTCAVCLRHRSGT